MSDQGAADELFGEDQRREVERQRALSRVLADLDDRIRTLGSQVQSVHSQMATLPSVATSVSELRGAVEILADRPVVDPTSGLRDELARVADRLDGIERQATVAPVATGVSAQDLDGLERRLVDLVDTTLGDRLVDVQRRLTELDEDVRSRTVQDVLDPATRSDLQEALRREPGVTPADLEALRQRLEAAVRPPSDDDRAREAVEDLRREVLDANAVLLDRIDAARTPVSAESDALREEIAQLRSVVEDMASAPRTADTGTDDAMRQRLDLLGEALSDLEVGRAAGDEAMRAAMSAMTDRLEAVAAGVEFEGRVREVVQDVISEAVAPTTEQTRHLTALVDGIAASLAAETSALRDQSAAVRSAITESIAEQRDDAAVAQLGLVERMETTLAEHRHELADMGARVDDATTGITEVATGLASQMRDVRDELATARDADRIRLSESLDEVRALVDASETRTGSFAADLQESLVARQRDHEAMVGELRALLEMQASQLQHALARSEEGIDGRLEEFQTVAERQVATTTETVGSMFDGRLANLQEELARSQRADEERQAQVVARVAELTDRVSSLAGDQLATGIEEIRADIDATRDVLRTSHDQGAALAALLDEVRTDATRQADTTRVALADAREASAASDLARRDELADELRRTVADLQTLVASATERSSEQISAAVEDLRVPILAARSSLGEEIAGAIVELRSTVATSQESTQAHVDEQLASVAMHVQEASSGTSVQLSGLESAVAAALAASESRVSETVAGVSASVDRVEAASSSAQSATSEHVSAVVEELRSSLLSTQRLVVEQLEHVVTTVGESQAVADARTASLVEDAREITGSAQDEAVARMTSLVDGVAASVAASAAATDQQLLVVVEDVRTAVVTAGVTSGEQVAAAVGELEAMRQQVDERTSEQISGLVADLRDAREQTAAEERAARDGIMDDLQDFVRTWSVGQADRIDDTVQELERVLSTTDTAQAERLAATVELITSAREETAVVGASLTEAVAAIQERGVSMDQQLETAVGEIAGLVADAQERLSSSADDFTARAATSLSGATEEVVQALRADLRADDEARTAGLRDTVRLLIDSSDERDRELADGIASSVTSLRSSVQALQEDVTGGLTQSRSGMQAALAAQAGRIQQLLDAATGRLDDAGQRVADQGEAMALAAAALATPLAELRESTTGSTEEIGRLAAASTSQEQSVRGLVDELAAMRERLDGELDRLTERTGQTIAAATAALAEERSEAAISLRAIVAESGNDLTRAQVALTRGSDAMLAAAAAQQDGTAELQQAASMAMQEAADRAAATFESRVESAWREASTTFEQRSQAALEDLRARLGDLRDEAVARQDGLESVVSSNVEGLVSSLTTELRQAESRVETAAQGLANLEQVFADYLTRRDAQMVADRDALVLDLVDQFAGGLSDRQRRRLAARVEPSDAGVPVDGAGDVIRDLLEAPRTEAAPVAADDEQVVRKSTARSRATSRSTPDVAAERDRLAAVTGLGPAKADRLLATFGDVATIRSASDEDLLAVSGIGPAVLQAIRAELV